MGRLEITDREFISIAKSIIETDEFIRLQYIKHHRTNRYKHSIRVAYMSYKIAKILKMDVYRVTRGALMHDLFFQEKQANMFRKHPKVALKNASIIFNLHEIEKDIIVKHMFPATIAIPKYKESWIVCFVDKVIALNEFCRRDYNLVIV